MNGAQRQPTQIIKLGVNGASSQCIDRYIYLDANFTENDLLGSVLNVYSS